MLKSWDQFERKVLIDMPVETIYALWTTSKGICSWFLREAHYDLPDGTTRPATEPCQSGDKYRWKWHNWDTVGTGEIITQNNKNHIQFSFESCTVDVNLSQFEDGRTLVSLKQWNIPTDDESKLNLYSGCGAGWTFWLTNLKAYCEHGIVLNETGMSLFGKFDGYQLVNT